MHYSRNLKAALICSLTVVLLLFVFFPRIKVKREKVPEISELFSVHDIPSTIQQSVFKERSRNRPETPPINIPDISINPEILSDADINSHKLNSGISGNNESNVSNSNNIDNFSFMPRQIKEVLPQKTNGEVKGFIKLSLMIGKDGKVEKYILLANTTNNSKCLQKVLNAVYKSRWQAAKIKGRKVKYWIEKEYNFK